MVTHLAVGILAAGANARVPAVEVKAGKVGRTLIVVLAVSTLAEHIRVALEA